MKITFRASEISPELRSSSTPHWPALEITLLFFWFWGFFCIVKTVSCFLFVCSFPWSLPNDTRSSQLPSTRVWVCPQLCLPTIPDFYSQFCSLCPQLQLVPGTTPSFRNWLGETDPQDERNRREISSVLPNSLAPWGCHGRQWEHVTFQQCPFTLVTHCSLNLHNKPIK